MPNLSGYLNFTVLLDFSTNKIVITDTSSYPTGVAAGITGIVYIKQPDGISITGSFTNPDISYQGGLHPASKKLRRTTKKEPQKGQYVIRYTVRHDDFEETTLERKFTLNYETPDGNIKKEFDVFTPSLFIEDDTTYSTPEYYNDVLTREWNITVGNLGPIVSTEKRVNLLYNENYYDARYVSLLKVAMEFAPTDASLSYLRIKDYKEYADISFANTPRPYPELLAMLNEIKEVEDGQCAPKVGGCSCSEGDYSRALELFNLIKANICGFNTVDLYAQLEEFLLIYYSHLPGYTNTNEIIQAYDRSFCANDPDNPGDDEAEGLPDDMEFWVGTTQGGPVAGESIYTNPALAGWNIRLFIGRNLQTKLTDVEGVGFTKIKEDNFLTLVGRVWDEGSLVQIQFVSGIKGSNVDGGVNQVQSNWAQGNPAAPDFIKNKPTVFPPAAHDHPMADINGLAMALSNKSDVGHSHAIANITGLELVLDGKAPLIHNHAISDITGLEEALSNASGALFTNNVIVTSTTTIAAENIGKVHQIRAESIPIIVTLPSLASIAANVLFFIESLDNNEEQHRIQAAPGEFIYFKGGRRNYFWMAPGEVAMLYRTPLGWFMMGDAVNLTNIGVPFLTYKLGPNQIALDGSFVNRIELPRLWEYVQTLTTNTLIEDSLWLTSSINFLGRTIPKPYRGCYSRGNDVTTFRIPDYRNMAVRGLNVFDGSLADPQRFHNYPGGFQLNEMLTHNHYTITDKGTNQGSFPSERGKAVNAGNSPIRQWHKTGGGGEGYELEGDTTQPTIGRTSSVGGNETRMDNIGLIWAINV